MATVSENGVEGFSVSAYVDELSSALSRALNLPDLNFDAETPQAQLVGALAIAFSRIDRQMIDLFNGMSIFTAVGAQLDALTGLFGVFRRPGARSTAAVTFTGTADTEVPSNTRLRSSEDAIFRTVEAATIPSGSTTVDVEAESINIGAFNVDANTINTIVSATPGIVSVTNAADGTEGTFMETDNQLRNRFVRVRAFNSIGSVDSIQGRVLQVEGVDHCVVIDNPTASEINVGTTAIAPYSILTVVQGGEDNSVASAILASKPAGSPTVGTTSATVTSITGLNEIVRFTRIVDVPIKVTLALDTQTGYTNDITTAIRSTLLDYVAELAPGESLDEERAKAQILAFSNFDISSIAFALKSNDNSLPATVEPINRLTLAEADVTITV